MIAGHGFSPPRVIKRDKRRGGWWQRAIVLVDMNAFFASIEQLKNPEWRGRPVAITNGRVGTTIITCSYEARAYGVRTGMRLRVAREHCPELIQAPSRPEIYARISSRIMRSLEEITPEVEVFSVDEAFLDITSVQRLHGSPVEIARRVKRQVLAASGIPCSVGLSGDKTTAKYAAKLNKPDGFTVIPPWEAKERLEEVPVTELCGINRGVGDFLAAHGVTRCGQMGRLPVSVLAARFGNLGRRIWLMCQGEDPEPIITRVSSPKTIGHGKVVPPGTTDRQTIETFLHHMSEKVAARLRRHRMEARRLFIGVRSDQGWIGIKQRLERPTDDGQVLFYWCRHFLDRQWRGEPLHQVQVTALSLAPVGMQQSLFDLSGTRRMALNSVQDQINGRYGEFAIAPAALLKRSQMPNVIAPSWKPEGVRETVL
ncbi:MAG TPA: DNA polymerase IV [Arenicellales bacterium]|nr:DNA polymerase IV [Acidiferrobacteraceae bacterium]HJP26340.1 DNA polymerase IV [Arenicellales bacterium]